MSISKLQTGLPLADSRLTKAMALNLAAWVDASVRCFDVETHYTESIWWRQPGGSGIYLAAIIHAEEGGDPLFADLEVVKNAWGGAGVFLYDCWGTHDLTQMGFEERVKNPWYLRRPAPIPASAPPAGISIEIVRTPEELAEFEWASWIGFEEPDTAPEIAFQGRQPFSQHASASLDSGDMCYLIARLDGQVVASTIAQTTEDMVGVYGISTLPQFRRRGYATALVHATVALRPDLPVSVFPDPVSVPIYVGMGFVPMGKIAAWQFEG